MTSTEQDCDKLIRELGGTVITFGRKGQRTKNTHGIPDRLYFVRGKMVWFEIKSPNDYLSDEQIVFLDRVQGYGGIAGCGNVGDLRELLQATVHPPPALQFGREQVLRYSTRQKALRGA